MKLPVIFNSEKTPNNLSVYLYVHYNPIIYFLMYTICILTLTIDFMFSSVILPFSIQYYSVNIAPTTKISSIISFLMAT